MLSSVAAGSSGSPTLWAEAAWAVAARHRRAATDESLYEHRHDTQAVSIACVIMGSEEQAALLHRADYAPLMPPKLLSLPPGCRPAVVLLVSDWQEQQAMLANQARLWSPSCMIRLCDRSHTDHAHRPASSAAVARTWGGCRVCGMSGSPQHQSWKPLSHSCEAA